MDYKFSVDQFIEKELEYFYPMKLRQEKYSPEVSKKFSHETVKQRSERISKEVYNIFGGTIKYGQFNGLKLVDKSTWNVNNLGLMCIGQYENEVLDFIFSDYLRNKQIFVDIGGGIGYYAIGVLKSKIMNTCYCFESNESSRKLINENWEENGKPGHLEIFGDVFIDFQKNLKNVDLSKTFILIDIEGAEFDLLTNENLMFLSKSIILVEIHNWVDDFEKKYTSLIKSVSNFFEIRILERKEKYSMNIDELRSFTDDNRLLLLSESRPCLMRYLIFLPKKI